MLSKIIPEQNLLPEFRDIIKKRDTEVTLQHDLLTLKRWFVSLDEYECLKILGNEDLLTSGTIGQNRQRLCRYLTELPEEKDEIKNIASVIGMGINNLQPKEIITMQ